MDPITAGNDKVWGISSVYAIPWYSWFVLWNNWIKIIQQDIIAHYVVVLKQRTIKIYGFQIDPTFYLLILISSKQNERIGEEKEIEVWKRKVFREGKWSHEAGFIKNFLKWKYQFQYGGSMDNNNKREGWKLFPPWKKS